MPITPSLNCARPSDLAKTTGIGSDAMTVGIATEATATATNPTLFAAQQTWSSVSGDTPALAAGGYDLYVACTNAIDDCI